MLPVRRIDDGTATEPPWVELYSPLSVFTCGPPAQLVWAWPNEAQREQIPVRISIDLVKIKFKQVQNFQILFELQILLQFDQINSVN
jgi:hypothetical protein